MKRKIAAILAADVVGYSRLVREDEEETLHRLDTCRAVFGDCIARFEGRVVDMAGDSILAEFPTAIDAVRCAVDAQESLRTRNLDCSPSRKMDYRIGITMGDVLERDGFLLGEGVNIASRLQAVAPAGGVCISRSVYEAVAHKISVKFVDVGQQHLKNIPDAVQAYTVTLDQEEARGKRQISSLPHVVSSALAGALILAFVSSALYLRGSAKQETNSAAFEPTRMDVEKCAALESDKDSAIAACTRLLESKPAPAALANYYGNRGRAFLSRGDLELALTDLNEALRLRPDSPQFLTIRAGARLKDKNVADAMRDVEKALSVDPNSAVALTTRGEIYETLDRKAEAIADFKRALAIDATIDEAKKGLARLTTRAEPW